MLRAGDAIALSVLTLLCVGVIMVNSADLVVGERGGVTVSSIILSRSSAYALAAMIALVLAASRPGHVALRVLLHALRRPGALWVAVVALGVLCALVYVPGLGRQVNGAYRWISAPLPGGDILSVQPSEFAKWGLVLAIAAYAAANLASMPRFWTGLFPGLVAAGAVGAFIALEDLGTGVLIVATACVILVAAGGRILHFVAMAPLGLLAIVVGILAEPYRMRRLVSFLDPYADPSGAGYHMIQSMVAVANGEAFGRGLGFGLQKFGYLPEDRTDFLFAVICEELGVAGALVVILLYLAILWAGWAILRREKELTLRLVCLGVLATLAMQAVINLFAVTGLGPTKGIALPLLSAGGTGWVLTAASLGMLVGIDRRHARAEEAEAHEQPDEDPPPPDA